MMKTENDFTEEFDFTVITPNLNYGRFLRECISSVSQQHGVCVEHLIMDGGSHDDSQEIASCFPNVIWNSEKDQGMSDAINKGFQKARGKWVMWLNSDDRLLPDVLKSVFNEARNSTADVIYGNYSFISKEGKMLRSMDVPKWSQFVNVHHCCYIGSTAAFYRRSTIIEKGYRLRDDFRYVMDGEFYARLHQEHKSFQKIPVMVAEFRLHEENASMTHLRKDKNMERILKAERQHVESRSIRRAYGITLFEDPYLNGIVDGLLWIAAKCWKQIYRL